MKLKPIYRIPEANIQAELYHKLKLEGIESILEYKSDGCKLDLIVVKGRDIKCIIEVKSYTKNRLPNYHTKQIEKYKKFNLPIKICGSMSDIPNTLKFIKEYL